MAGRLFVGNLPDDVRENELGRMFEKFGPIRTISVKINRRQPGVAFAFVTFDELRDAEDAIRERHGVNFDGRRVTVEFAKGAGPRERLDRGDRRGPPGRERPARSPAVETGFTVEVTGIPDGTSWQDVKDHMRQAADVGKADVIGDGRARVHFLSRDGMERALRMLDMSEITNRHRATATIRLDPVSRPPRDAGGASYGGARRDDRGAPPSAPTSDERREGEGEDRAPAHAPAEDDAAAAGGASNGGAPAGGDGDGDAAVGGDEKERGADEAQAASEEAAAAGEQQTDGAAAASGSGGDGDAAAAEAAGEGEGEAVVEAVADEGS